MTKTALVVFNFDEECNNCLGINKYYVCNTDLLDEAALNVNLYYIIEAKINTVKQYIFPYCFFM